MFKTSGSIKSMIRLGKGVVRIGGDSRARRDRNKLEKSKLDKSEIDNNEIDNKIKKKN